jgi:DNA-binding NtrC family response regulator
LEDLPAPISRIEPLRRTSSPPSAPSYGLSTFAEVERDLIWRALEACQWNKVHAAAMLRISRKKLYAKINKYQLEKPGERTEQEE